MRFDSFLGQGGNQLQRARGGGVVGGSGHSKEVSSGSENSPFISNAQSHKNAEKLLL